MWLPSFSFRITPNWLTNGGKGLSLFTTSNVLMKTLVFVACAGPLNTVFHSMKFSCCCFPRKTPHGHFSVLERREEKQSFNSSFAQACTSTTEQFSFGRTGSRVVELQFEHCCTQKSIGDFRCASLLYFKFNTGRFCWKDLYSCVQRCWHSLNRRGNTDALKREPRGKQFTRQEVSMVSCDM